VLAVQSVRRDIDDETVLDEALAQVLAGLRLVLDHQNAHAGFRALAAQSDRPPWAE
jgi:hypothetical protein